MTETFITKWGTIGSDDGQFISSAGIAVDEAGHVFVADFGNYRIQVFTNEGNFLTKWGSKGSANGQFEYAWAVAVGRSRNVFVADGSNNRIQKFACP
jgi:tripartite motif-containing protein 71